MRWILWKLGLVDVVNTFYNGNLEEPRVRIVYYGMDGKRFVKAITGVPDNELLPDGKVKTKGDRHRYLDKWEPYTGIQWRRESAQLRWFRPHARRMFGRLTQS